MATVPYTYLIGWTTYNKWYYGVRFRNNCNPSDLWVKYFTSSKYVAQFRAEFGEPDVIQVRRVFDNKTKARLFESKVLQRIGAVKRDDFLNRSDLISTRLVGPANPRYGKCWSEEHKRQISNKLKGKRTGEDHPMYNKTWNEVFGDDVANLRKQQQSQRNTGPGNAMWGKHHTEETRLKISEKRYDGTGSKNPNARPVVIDDVQYDCILDACDALNISYYKVKKLIKGDS